MEKKGEGIKNKIVIYINIIIKSFFVITLLIILKILFVEQIIIEHPKEVLNHPLFGIYYLFIIFQFYYIFFKK
jgi:hypothetical protein